MNFKSSEVRIQQYAARTPEGKMTTGCTILHLDTGISVTRHNSVDQKINLDDAIAVLEMLVSFRNDVLVGRRNALGPTVDDLRAECDDERRKQRREIATALLAAQVSHAGITNLENTHYESAVYAANKLLVELE
jgi:hypothetical protein